MADIRQASRQLSATDSRLNDAADLVPLMIMGMSGNDKAAAMKQEEFFKRLRSGIINRNATVLTKERVIVGTKYETLRYRGAATDGTTLWALVATPKTGSNNDWHARAYKLTTFERDPGKDITVNTNTSNIYEGIAYDGTYLNFLNDTTERLEAWQVSDRSRQSSKDLTLLGLNWIGATYSGTKLYAIYNTGWLVYNGVSRSEITAEGKYSNFPNGYPAGIVVGSRLYLPRSTSPLWRTLPGGANLTTPPFAVTPADQPFNSPLAAQFRADPGTSGFATSTHVYYLSIYGLLFANRISDGTWDMSKFVSLGWMNETPIISTTITPSSTTAEVEVQLSFSVYNSNATDIAYNIKVHSSTAGIVYSLNVIQSSIVSASERQVEPITARFVDTPGVTSQVTYSLRMEPLNRQRNVVQAGTSMIVQEV